MLRKFVPNNRGLCSLFGSNCATIVQPKGTTVRNMPTFSHIAMSRHHTNVSANLPNRRRERRTDKSTKSCSRSLAQFLFGCLSSKVFCVSMPTATAICTPIIAPRGSGSSRHQTRPSVHRIKWSGHHLPHHAVAMARHEDLLRFMSSRCAH